MLADIFLRFRRSFTMNINTVVYFIQTTKTIKRLLILTILLNLYS